MFWAATDDADFAEASSTAVARPGGADLLRDTGAPPPGTPMALAPLTDVTALLDALAAASGSGADHRPLAAARAAYGAPGATVGGAYVTLLRELLAPLGIPVLDASHPAVIAASADVVAAALGRAVDIETALVDRSAELRAAGFEPQVEDMAGLSLVFGRSGTIKRRLAVGEQPGADTTLTPNVLLRPIVEHEILPTVAYCAGPGELAYFAQVDAVARAMDVASQLAVPRWSCTLLEPHVEAVLQRLVLQREDLRDPHAPERRLAMQAMSERSAAGLQALRMSVSGEGDFAGDALDPFGGRFDRSGVFLVDAVEGQVDVDRF